MGAVERGFQVLRGRGAIAAGILALALVGVAVPAQAAPAASASVSMSGGPLRQYVGDSDGKTFTFTVRNTGARGIDQISDRTGLQLDDAELPIRPGRMGSHGHIHRLHLPKR